MFIKSPLNYIGNKFKLLNQITPLFPSKIDKFVDLFMGGGDVSINVHANVKYANDYIDYLIEMYIYFQNNEIDYILSEIKKKISDYSLSINNVEGYNKLRHDYNNKKDPLTLFVLQCYSFNHQIRFNNSFEFNIPFGKRGYNKNIENNLILFCNALKNIIFSSKNYKDFDFTNLKESDFVYCDPPYLITVGSYNDGSSGFPCWKSDDDLKLFEILDYLDSKNVKFALSNVLESKGMRNENLIKFADKYNTHHLNYNYYNCSYHKKDRISKNDEVLITNYIVDLDW